MRPTNVFAIDEWLFDSGFCLVLVGSHMLADVNPEDFGILCEIFKDSAAEVWCAKAVPFKLVLT